MPRLHLAISLALLCGCYSTSSSTIRRGQTFAFPTRGPVFATYFELKKTKTTNLIPKAHKDASPEVSYASSVVRTWPIRIDPHTGRATRYAWVDGAVRPFYWDSVTAVLWVADPEDRSVLGVSPDGARFPGTQDDYKALIAPFAAARSGDDIFIWNAATNVEIALAVDKEPTIHVDGSVVRLNTIENDGVRIRVHQRSVDWSNASKPVRLPDTLFMAPFQRRHVNPTLTADGRYLVSLLETGGQSGIVAYDLVRGSETVRAVSSALSPETAIVEPLGASLVVARDPRPSCWQGDLFDAASSTVVELTAALCVTGVVPDLDRPGAVLLSLAGGVGYLDPARGELVKLGEVKAPTANGAASILLGRGSAGSYAIQNHDLATAESTTLATRVRAPTFLHLAGDTLVIGEGNQLSAHSIGGTARPLVVPAFAEGPSGVRRAYDGGIGNRLRTSMLALGTSFGIATNTQLVVEADAQIRRYLRGRWTLGAGLAAAWSLENDDADPPGYWAAYGTGSIYRYQEPGIRGLFVAGEIRLGVGAESARDGERRWGPALGGRVAVGYQRRWSELSLGAETLHALDLDRGVVFAVGIRVVL